MEDTGRRLIQQVPKTADFHSAVLTTFSFDFNHFESQVLRTLKQKGVTSFNIMVDTAMLDKSIGFSTGHLKSLSNHYSVHTIPCTGAFHPKIIFLAGEDEVMFIQGSGNITTGGHGKNHELFGAYYANKKDQSQLPIIQETWEYLKGLMKSVKGIGATKFDRIETQCNLLNQVKFNKHNWNPFNDHFSVAALYNDESSIWNQITNLLPKDGIKLIKVFSPFFDEKGTLLRQMVKHFDCPTSAFMQAEKGIHPHRMETDNRVQFLDWDSTERATVTTKKYKRKLHSKIFWFDAGEEQYCLFGSPNATIRAFGSEKSRGANDEFALLFKIKGHGWIDVLGLNGDFKAIVPQQNENIKKIEDDLEEEQTKNLKKVRLLGADQNDEILTIYISNHNELKNAQLKVFNKWAEELEVFPVQLHKNKLQVKLKAENSKETAYIELFNSKGESISNKQITNTFFDLWNSDPSQDNRDLIKLGTEIEMGKNGLFAVIEFFNSLQTKRNATNSGHSGNTRTNNDSENKMSSLASLTYEEACALDMDDTNTQKIIRHHHTVQIFDAIEKRFRDFLKEEEEEDMDDEEDEKTATSGRKRKEKKDFTAPEHLSSTEVLKKRRKKIIKFLGYYQSSLDKVLKIENHTIGVVDLAMYLIVLNNLIDFAEREVIIANFKEGEETSKHVLFPVEGSYNELSSLNSAIFNLVGKFISLLDRGTIQETIDHYSQRKLEKYKLLCRRTTLFTLATMKSRYNTNEQIAGWYDILAYNIIKHFGKLEPEFQQFLENFGRNVSINNFTIEKTEDILQNWGKEFDSVKLNSFLCDSNRYGICRIITQIPPKGEVKYYRLARPGNPFSKDYGDFILPRLYTKKTGELISSKQKHDKIENDKWKALLKKR